MHKSELITQVADITGESKKKVANMLDTALYLIISAVASGDKVQLNGFGSFELKNRKARIGRNPQTGDKLTIPAKQAPVFKPAAQFKMKAL